MKRLFVVILFALAVAGAWSQTLTLMGNGVFKVSEAEAQFRYKDGLFEEIVARFATDNKIKVNIVNRDVSKGSLTFDTMLAAGTPPDVWWDAGSYMINYMKPEYALPMQKYMDLKDYNKGLLDAWTINGNVYCVPLVNIATGMAVNLSMLKQVGYTLPEVEGWTTEEFLKVGAKLKAIGIPATMIMGKGGINSWTVVWLYSFGGALFAPGDFSKTTINTPQAIAGLNYMKTLIDRGYTPPPLEINDDDGVERFTTNQVFSCMLQNGHSDPTFPEQVKQGKIDKIPDYSFIEFPHAVGRQHTPVSGYQTVVLAHKNANENTNKLIGKLVAAITNRETQWYFATVSGGFPTINGFAPDVGAAQMPTYKAIANLAKAGGIYKAWPDGPKGQEFRRIWNTLSEQWLLGKLTAAQFLAQVETEGNKVLK
jgi:ABC-type glycerol-3-phosphate transport system substrate-binding protein